MTYLLLDKPPPSSRHQDCLLVVRLAWRLRLLSYLTSLGLGLRSSLAHSLIHSLMLSSGSPNSRMLQLGSSGMVEHAPERKQQIISISSSHGDHTLAAKILSEKLVVFTKIPTLLLIEWSPHHSLLVLDIDRRLTSLECNHAYIGGFAWALLGSPRKTEISSCFMSLVVWVSLEAWR